MHHIKAKVLADHLLHTQPPLYLQLDVDLLLLRLSRRRPGRRQLALQPLSHLLQLSASSKLFRTKYRTSFSNQSVSFSARYTPWP